MDPIQGTKQVPHIKYFSFVTLPAREEFKAFEKEAQTTQSPINTTNSTTETAPNTTKPLKQNVNDAIAANRFVGKFICRVSQFNITFLKTTKNYDILCEVLRNMRLG